MSWRWRSRRQRLPSSRDDSTARSSIASAAGSSAAMTAARGSGVGDLQTMTTRSSTLAAVGRDSDILQRISDNVASNARLRGDE
ncbi:hypothetical protein Dimus_006080, partial [Dionaea muscipula]